MTFLADLRAHRRLIADRDYWRNRALAAEHAESECVEMNIGLRRRCDELEHRLPAGSIDGLLLAHRLEVAEAELAQLREATG